MLRQIATAVGACGLLIASVAMAASAPATDLRKHVVLLQSGLCGGPATSFSTGVLVKRQWMPGIPMNAGLILTTSSSVVSDLGENSCTDAVLPNGKRIPLKVYTQDWARGIAYLAFKDDSVVKTVLPIDNFLDSVPNHAQKLPDQVSIVAGSMRDRKIAVSTVSTLVQATHRSRMVAPLATAELFGGLFDAGVRGGAVFSTDGSTFLGMVSDEYLNIQPGHPTQAMRWTNQASPVSNHLLVTTELYVPMGDVSAQLSLWPEAGTPLAFKAGFLLFTPRCTTPPTTGPVVGPDPIGGGDMIGIGGGDVAQPTCSLQVTLDKRGSSIFPIEGYQEWADALQARLEAGASVQIVTEARDYYEAGFRWQSQAISSAETFFRDMLQNPTDEKKWQAYLPVAVVTNPSPLRDEFRDQAQLIVDSTRAQYGLFFGGNPKTILLLRKIYLLALLSQSDQAHLLLPYDFKCLTDGCPGSWSDPELADTWKEISNRDQGKLNSQLKAMTAAFPEPKK